MDRPLQVVNDDSTILEGYLPNYPRLRNNLDNLYNQLPFVIGTMRIIGATNWSPYLPESGIKCYIHGKCTIKNLDYSRILQDNSKMGKTELTE